MLLHDCFMHVVCFGMNAGMHVDLAWRAKTAGQGVSENWVVHGECVAPGGVRFIDTFFMHEWAAFLASDPSMNRNSKAVVRFDCRP